jgi:hypothetical protein
MYKLVKASDFNLGGIPVVRDIKWASAGLYGHDYRALVKLAGEGFAEQARRIKIASDQVPVHVIAMGSTERYGPNRNGDGFKEAMLAKYAKTFETHAKWFRHHKNKSSDRHYGQVKLAYWNPRMSRVELLVALNATKEAAAKYGGFPADQEIQLVKSGKDIPVSMAIQVPHDVCSACGNVAKTRRYYCKSAEEGGKCTLFGCMYGLTKVSADGHIQHVDNPEGTFIDISMVDRNADRIAKGNIASYLQKAASEQRVLSGAELAEIAGYLAPAEYLLPGFATPTQRAQMKAAMLLAKTEQALQGGVYMVRDLQPEPLDWQVPLAEKSAALSAAASSGVLLTLIDFGRFYGWSEDRVKAAEAALPGIFSRICADGRAETAIREGRLRLAEPSESMKDRVRTKLAESRSLAPKYRMKRAMLAALRDQAPQRITVSRDIDAGDDSDAAVYALYKIACFAAHGESSILTPESVVLQNHASA